MTQWQVFHTRSHAFDPMQQTKQKSCPAAPKRLNKLYGKQLDLENGLQTRFTLMTTANSNARDLEDQPSTGHCCALNICGLTHLRFQ